MSSLKRGVLQERGGLASRLPAQIFPISLFFHLPLHQNHALFSQKLRLQLKHVFIFQWPATSQYPSDLNSRRIFVVRAPGNALDKVSKGSHSFLVTHFETTTRHLGNIFSECTREL